MHFLIDRKFWSPTGAFWTPAEGNKGFQTFAIALVAGVYLWQKAANAVAPTVVRNLEFFDVISAEFLSLL
jgi:hypothetical protein